MSSTDKCRPKIAVAVVVCGDKILLLQRASQDGSVWTFPGGKIEPGEQPSQAASRELFEEVGILGVANKKLGRRVHPDSGADVSYFLFRAPVMHAAVGEREKFQSASWFSLDDVEKRTNGTLFKRVRDELTKISRQRCFEFG